MKYETEGAHDFEATRTPANSLMAFFPSPLRKELSVIVSGPAENECFLVNVCHETSRRTLMQAKANHPKSLISFVYNYSLDVSLP